MHSVVRLRLVFAAVFSHLAQPMTTPSPARQTLTMRTLSLCRR